MYLDKICNFPLIVVSLQECYNTLTVCLLAIVMAASMHFKVDYCLANYSG